MIEMIQVTIALGFNFFDFGTGIIKALKSESKLSSSKLRDGLFKKVGFILCYILGWGINYASIYISLPFTINLLPIIVGYAIVTEVVSITENICIINPDIVPSKLKDLIGFKGGD